MKRKSPSLWSDDVLKNSHLYEKYETSSQQTSDGWMDMNYAGSAFMLLALVNELQMAGISEHKAFELVFRDFWIEQSKQTNWTLAFEKTFNLSVADFYVRLSQYKRKDVAKILPRKSLKIQAIFDWLQFLVRLKQITLVIERIGKAIKYALLLCHYEIGQS